MKLPKSNEQNIDGQKNTKLEFLHIAQKYLVSSKKSWVT